LSTCRRNTSMSPGQIVPLTVQVVFEGAEQEGPAAGQ
jgi:hypothetical protein